MQLLTDSANENKKAQATKKCNKRNLKTEDYENCLRANPLENKIKYLENKKLMWIV